MTNDEVPNDETTPKSQARMAAGRFVIRYSEFLRHWVLRHSSFRHGRIGRTGTMSIAVRRVTLPLCALVAGYGLALLFPGGPRGARATPLVPQPPADEPSPPPAAAKTNVVRQGFPAANSNSEDLTKNETAWEVEWELTHPENRPVFPPGSIFRIKSAKFMWKDRTGKPHWVTVARMLE